MNEKQVLITARDQFALKNLSDEAMREILPVYKEAVKNILLELNNLPPDGSIQREFWLRQQLNTIEQQLKRVGLKVKEVLPQKQLEAWDKAMENAEAFLRADGIKPPVPQAELAGTKTSGQIVSQTGNLPSLATETNSIFVNPSNPIGEFLRPSITRQQVLAAAQDRGFKEFLSGPTGANKKGFTLDQLLEINTKRQVDKVSGILREGFLLSRSNEEIARRVGDAFGGKTKGQAIAMTNSLVRTGMAEASRAAHDAFYKANEDLLPKVPGGYRWEWDASNDTRLCELCAPLDGLRFKEREDAPPWPAHWGCRCKILPITATQAALRERGDVPQGSFLEQREVKKINGKNEPPPAGWNGRRVNGVKVNENAYARPQKINGKMYWVRRVDMAKGKTLAGDMLVKMNQDSKHAVLGNWKLVERFDVLTKPGGRYVNNPQGAVRLLLSGSAAPPAGAAGPMKAAGRQRRR